LLFVEPFLAVMIGWLVAMPSRQIGHFFFEPKGYDEANQATHEHKEQIKVGYNLHRKAILLSIWALCPLLLLLDPTIGGMLQAAGDWEGFARNTAIVWLSVAGGALIFRTVQLFFLRDVQTGLVWLIKILSDPFHDVTLYYKVPIQVWRGELFDPIVRESAA
jgi:hypothetical protein